MKLRCSFVNEIVWLDWLNSLTQYQSLAKDSISFYKLDSKHNQNFLEHDFKEC